MSITKEQMDKAIADAIAQSIEQFRAGPEFTGLKTENERLSAELENAKETTLAIQLRADINDCMGTAKRLLDEKKVTPAVYNAGLGAFLASLDNQDEIELGDKKQTRRAYAISLLESMPAKKGLFTAVDDVQTREGEDVPADIEAFAQKYGIDPKIVLQNYQKLRTGKLTENSTDGE